MERWRCPACNYIYDHKIGEPEHGVKPGTPFEDLPNGWVCSQCGVQKIYMFEKIPA